MPSDVPGPRGSTPSALQQPRFDSVGMTTLTVLHKELVQALRESTGLNMTQYRVLLKVREGAGPVRLGSIAAALAIAANVATQAADALEERRLVVRLEVYDDGRGTALEATVAGVELVHTADAALAAHLVRLWDQPMSGVEQTAYRTAIQAIGSRLEGAGGDAPAQSLVTSGYITSVEEGLRGATAAVRSAGGATLSECRVLQHLNEAGGRGRIAEAAAALLMSSSTITHVIDRLESRGWVARASSAEDRRSVDLEMSRTGRAALAGMRAALDEFGRTRLWAQLTPEQAALTYEAALRLVAVAARRAPTR